MAKKNKQGGPPQQQQKGVSAPESFTHGMVSDLDPHFQLSGSYSDAQNIRLTNSEGDTFTVENIEGNSLFVDLSTYPIYSENVLSDGTVDVLNNYPTFYDRGPTNSPLSDNLKIENRCSIVGHISYANQLLLMIVGRFEWDRNFGVPISSTVASTDPVYTDENTEIDRTIFLLVDFDHEMKVKKVTDLRVCYNTSGFQYPDLGMDLDTPVRMEHIIENERISRIYWTDNKNPLRTLNIKNFPNLDDITIESLDITPLMSPSQPALDLNIFGSLPVGVYQYTYKLLSENGGETTFSPLSNLYHVSDQGFSNSSEYAGGPKGNVGTQGFQISVADIDQNFQYIELYSLFYDEYNSPPRVAVVSRNTITAPGSVFQHATWNNEVENGLEEILIESNTFDVCKDIAIKDNILFAANLRQKRNFISEKEWNVKVLRWRIANGSSTKLDAMLTTNDPAIKHYELNTSGEAVSVNNSSIEYNVQDERNDRVGYGQLLGQANGMYPAATNTHLNYDGNLNVPMWATAISSQRTENVLTGGGGFHTVGKLTYKYLSDRMTVGAESFNYGSNGLGGCRISFGVEEKIADISQNAYTSPFISSTARGGEIATEFGEYHDGTPINSGTTFKASMSLGGSKDPHLAGNTRGYQRGEIYRFGVQVYDLNGSPGNVLWIGDVETPHMYDVSRMINIKKKSTAGNTGYSPFMPTEPGITATYSHTDLLTSKNIIAPTLIKDHRLSYVYGHVVPPIDVEWFSARANTAYQNLAAYIRDDGAQQTQLPTIQNSYNNTLDGAEGLIKAVPARNESRGGPEVLNHDDTHYLFDLYASFEFIIPDSVCKKISGFRVVRAERKEEDRRIIQQGLLNQTAQYGSAQLGSRYGYGMGKFSQKDNEAFSDDPVFVNETTVDGTAPTEVEQPEYNVYLNGYLGLAEHSFMAWYQEGLAGGKATQNGQSAFANEIFYWPEREDARIYATPPSTTSTGNSTATDYDGMNSPRGQGANALINTNEARFGGPGTHGRQHRHCGYFGSFDKMAMYQTAANGFVNSDIDKIYDDLRNRPEISGNIFTLDAPDSAFGMRPYVYREGDMLRIDDILKLTDERRYDNRQGAANNPHGYVNHGRTNTGGSYEAQDNSASTSGLTNWYPINHNKTNKEALSFSTRKDIDKDYSILVGKYYSYDPYFAIGMEIDGGKFAASKSGTASDNKDDSPKKTYGWQLPISASKEISDGEIVPSGFFKVSKRVKEGKVSGFSNNTLGFVNKAKHATEGWFNTFGAVTKQLPNKKDSSGGVYSDVKEGDYNYDTVSTLQMGLRSILIEVDNRCSVVRLNGPGTSFFENRMDRRYGSWFAPINVGALYEHGCWQGKDYLNNTPSGSGTLLTATFPSGNYVMPYRTGWLSSRGINELGSLRSTENYDEGDLEIYQRGRSYIPYKYLCSIVRKVTPYGGYNKGAIEKTRYIPCGNYHAVGESNGEMQGHASQVFGGDTFVNLYSHQKTSSPYMKKSASRWQVFPVESYVNTDMRSGLTLNAGDTVVGKDINTKPYSNDWLYNSIYSQENNIRSGLLVDEKKFQVSLDLPYEIAYSNTKILGQESDAFRQFPINQFHNMEGLYGEINRIVNFRNEIYVLQDSAFSKLLVNPLSMLSDDAGTSLFTGTGETVENHIYISTKYGSRHRFSVAMSEKSLFFVDSNFGRLFKYDTEKLISLGDALGQRNYLKYIIKEWEQRAYRICTNKGGSGGIVGGVHTSSTVSTAVLHGTHHGLLDSVEKPDGDRNYLSDNPLNFLGITSVYDFTNKELLITFHNSSWNDKNNKRQAFARTIDNHSMANSTDGEPVGHSETLVYSEAINAFTSKYSVAPPQWLTGGQGSFILCPENEINVVSIADFNESTGKSKDASLFPYSLSGANQSDTYRVRRCNPLKLWLWDNHNLQMKNHFFDKRDVVYGRPLQTVTSPVDNTSTAEGKTLVTQTSPGRAPDESYIVKTVNSEAPVSKVFDNAQIIMTPKHVDYSFIDYTTDITHDTIKATSVLDDKTELLDETEQLVINRRWNFDGTTHGWSFYDGNAYQGMSMPGGAGSSFVQLHYDGDGRFRSPDNNNGTAINLPGKYNNIIRMRVKRNVNVASAAWQGTIYWKGFDPIRKLKGDYLMLGEVQGRSVSITEPLGTGDFGQDVNGADIVGGIDADYVILEWDMSAVLEWNECTIYQIRIDLVSGDAKFLIDWIEIGGLKADKYLDGILRLPLRTEKSKRRTRGTYAKIKYSAKTTEKFNIFAILAKYRETY